MYTKRSDFNTFGRFSFSKIRHQPIWLKPGSSPGFFRLVCTRFFLFLDTKKRPKLLKLGRFVYIFVYKFRKSLNFNVYCGERGSQTLDKVQFHEMPFCRKQGFSPFPSVFYNTTQYHLRALKSCTKSCTWVFVPFFVYIIKIHQTLTLHGL